MKTYIHLTQFDRTLIAYLLQQNMSLSQIAYQLKRSKSTVSSEISRNSNKTGYNPETADKRALARRHKTCVLDQNQNLQAYVVDRLREGHSPELIAVRLKRYPEPGIPYISHNAIYDWLYKPHQIKQRLYKLLRQGKRTRGRRKRTHRSLIGVAAVFGKNCTLRVNIRPQRSEFACPYFFSTVPKVVPC